MNAQHFAVPQAQQPWHLTAQEYEWLIRADDDYDYRIPSVLAIPEGFVCTFERRPRMPAQVGWEKVGGAMPADLPNPNQIMAVTSSDGRLWSEPKLVPGMPPVSSDCSIVYDGTGITAAYMTSQNVGYFGSSFAGEHLRIFFAYGRDIWHMEHRECDELYDILQADAIFATSGSAACFQDMAAFPLVLRPRAGGAEVVIAYVRHGKLAGVSEPVRAQELLDETAIVNTGSGLLLSCRLQGKGGRLSFFSEDGKHFEPVDAFAHLHPPTSLDAGCNAALKIIAGELVLSHPRCKQRRDGVIETADGTIRAHYDSGEFSYSDIAAGDTWLLAAYERENGIRLMRGRLAVGEGPRKLME